MKTKMSLEDRVEIVKMVLENRVEEGTSMYSCPFMLDCSICGRIFPKWSRVKRFAHKCPCGAMGPYYVKRRMKKLFPELY